MPRKRTRRTWLKEVGAAGAGSMLARAPIARAASIAPQPPAAPRGETIVARTSTSDVFVPPRGRSFQKFSFDFPEPSVRFAGCEFGFRIFTHENTYGLSSPRIVVAAIDGGLEITCTELIWAGGQQRASGRLTARLTARADVVECDVTVEMPQPIKSVATIVRGIPRGRISAGGAPFFDPRDDEVLLGYPFSGGDLFGPSGNGGLTTPLVVIQPPGSDAIVALSSRDDRMRTKRFYLQPGVNGYRVEALVEAEGWHRSNTLHAPVLRIARTTTIAEATEPHFAHVERAFHISHGGIHAATCPHGCAALLSSSRFTACITRGTSSTITRA